MSVVPLFYLRLLPLRSELDFEKKKDEDETEESLLKFN
jgi:hypothetical protein